jgi:hypothetical protein
VPRKYGKIGAKIKNLQKMQKINVWVSNLAPTHRPGPMLLKCTEQTGKQVLNAENNDRFYSIIHYICHILKLCKTYSRTSTSISYLYNAPTIKLPFCVYSFANT